MTDRPADPFEEIGAQLDQVLDVLHELAERVDRLEREAARPEAARVPGTPVVWDELIADHRIQLWPDFITWVIWLADTYELTTDQLPRCWWRHGGLVGELTDLWTTFRSAHDPAKGDTGSAPYLWGDALGRCLDRIASKWLAECRNGTHVPKTRRAWGDDEPYRSELLAWFAPAAPDSTPETVE